MVLVLLTGRPYAIGWAMDRCAAVIQTFFPGEEGGTAVAGVLTGRVNPSGHLPVTMPRSTGAQPYTYLHSALGGDGDVTSVGTAPVRPFGFGLSYTIFDYGDLSVSELVRPDGVVTASVTVTNAGPLAGEDVVQLYVRDVLASVSRPVAQLVGFQRVALEAGSSATVTFEVPTARLAFSNRDLVRVVFGVVLISQAAVLTLVASGLGRGSAPIYPLEGRSVSDPLSQAMALTAIVIGLAVTALLLVLVLRVVHAYRSPELARLASREAARDARLERLHEREHADEEAAAR